MAKLLLLIISATLLVYGIIAKIEYVPIAGSAFYILSLCIGIIQLARMLKKPAENKPVEIDAKPVIEKIVKVLEGCILFSGLILMMIDNNKSIKTAGIIIWVGSILLYFVSGIIIENITKTPLEFGYGGWRPKRFKTKRRR
jgi:hypothetical protein